MESVKQTRKYVKWTMVSVRYSQYVSLTQANLWVVNSFVINEFIKPRKGMRAHGKALLWNTSSVAIQAYSHDQSNNITQKIYS